MLEDDDEEVLGRRCAAFWRLELYDEVRLRLLRQGFAFLAKSEVEAVTALLAMIARDAKAALAIVCDAELLDALFCDRYVTADFSHVGVGVGAKLD